MIAPDRSFPNGSPVCEYWLSRCEGFVVRAGHRTVGVVEKVDRDGRMTGALVLRKGRHRRQTLPADDVLAVVPARRLLLARRHQHAMPAMRRVYASTKSVAIPVAAALWALTLRAARTLRREVPRLARLVLAEVHDRNERHGDEPGVGRAHRRANEYAFQQPVGRGRNVGPIRSR